MRGSRHTALRRLLKPDELPTTVRSPLVPVFAGEAVRDTGVL